MMSHSRKLGYDNKASSRLKSQTKKEVTDTDIDTNRWVLNLSDRQISDDE